MAYRTRHLCYRCYRCTRVLTSIEIEKKWESAEREKNDDVALCRCGSRHITPTNPKLWEELFLPRIWRLWIERVVYPKLRAAFQR